MNNIIKCIALTYGSVLSLAFTAQAQSVVSLNDLSSFQTPAANWRIAGDVSADLAKNGEMNSSKGTGVLVNLPEKKEAKDLFTNFQHGDLDLELDYMMAKGSNSGIYLQGRYEVQLLDSWGNKNPKPGDNGGIYERWDDNKPEGQRGFEGTAPRQNASKAPGLWQHLKISFQAPRFDAAGKKIENAKVIRVELNGVPIQENVELSGPTRGGVSNNEVASGPLRFQGDHGPVAFRNIKVINYDKPRPELTDLTYTIYKGKFEKEPDFAKLPPEARGTSVILSSTVNKIPNDFLIRYTGKLNVKEAGAYNFNLSVPGGTGLLKINNEVIIPINKNRSNNVNLPAGTLPFELLYSKFVSWTNPALGLTVSGEGIREYLISDVNNSTNEVVDPILIGAATNTVLRSFIDIPGGKRVVHAVSVGTSQQVHYTYDLDHGMMIQAWRGDFLDATSMWHGRGDGSSRPMGAVQYFGMPRFTIGKLATPLAAWPLDTIGTGFFTKGYILNENDLPTFRYLIYNTMVNDAIMPLENGQGLQRQLILQNPGDNFYVRIANGKSIERVENGIYLVDDKSYYLRIDDAGNAKPVIRDVDGQKELIIPVQGKLIYSILF